MKDPIKFILFWTILFLSKVFDSITTSIGIMKGYSEANTILLEYPNLLPILSLLSAIGMSILYINDRLNIYMVLIALFIFLFPPIWNIIMILTI